MDAVIVADRSKVTQVVRNMVSNALKFTKTSVVTKEVKMLVDFVPAAG